MKILLISKSDIKGGAAKVAFELGRGLRGRDHQVTLLVEKKSSTEEWVEEISSIPERKGTVSQKIIHRLGLNTLSLNSPFPRCLEKEYIEQFDVVHLHDLPGIFNLTQLPWLTRIRPTFWTLHTLNAFTGGCLYPYSCERFKRSCGRCPQFGQFPLHFLHRDGSRLVMLLRKWIYRRSRLQIICVSEWLASQAKKGILKRFPIHVIQNPVDTTEFYPIDKAEAKRQLGIPPHKKTILFSVAANPLDTRKGFDIICEALKQLNIPDLFLIPTSIAADSSALEEALTGRESLPPRHLSTNEELRLHYSAADVVWHPTRADTSSMVGLEAMACGTPVIAARVGGVPEVIPDGHGGILIEPDSPQALTEATEVFFGKDSGSRGKLKTQVNPEHTVSAFIERNLSLYTAGATL